MTPTQTFDSLDAAQTAYNDAISRAENAVAIVAKLESVNQHINLQHALLSQELQLTKNSIQEMSSHLDESLARNTKLRAEIDLKGVETEDLKARLAKAQQETRVAQELYQKDFITASRKRGFDIDTTR